MKFAKWLSVLLGCLIALYLLVPQERFDSLKESWQRDNGDPGVACLDFERRRLPDPDSARLLTTATAGRDVTVTYKSKNRYGAYEQSSTVCVIDATSKVDPSQTEIVRGNMELGARNARMREIVACLTRQNQLQRDGSSVEEAIKEMGGACPTK